MSRIVCVGNPKTATTSLKEAMEILGYNSLGFDINCLNYWCWGNIDICIAKANNFKFLKDWPWRQCYKEIDKVYENCKFILTLRDPNNWVESYINHIKKDIKFTSFNELMTRSRIKAYGFNPLDYINKKSFLIENLYEKQNQDVRSYFSNRKHDLFEVDFTSKPSFRDLCLFLKKEEPNVSFPHSNKRI